MGLGGVLTIVARSARLRPITWYTPISRRETKRTMPEQTQPVGVLVKTIDVLRTLARNEAPLGPTEIAALTGLDRSAVHRILSTLARDRLVERVDSNGSYRLGLGLAALGLVAASRLDLRRAARPHLEAV